MTPGVTGPEGPQDRVLKSANSRTGFVTPPHRSKHHDLCSQVQCPHPNTIIIRFLEQIFPSLGAE